MSLFGQDELKLGVVELAALNNNIRMLTNDFLALKVAVEKIATVLEAALQPQAHGTGFKAGYSDHTEDGSSVETTDELKGFAAEELSRLHGRNPTIDELETIFGPTEG